MNDHSIVDKDERARLPCYGDVFRFYGIGPGVLLSVDQKDHRACPQRKFSNYADHSIVFINRALHRLNHRSVTVAGRDTLRYEVISVVVAFITVHVDVQICKRITQLHSVMDI